MDFTDTSTTRPGYTIYEADDTDHPGHHYVIQRKNEGSTWLVGFRETDTDPIRIIYATTSLVDAESYANTYRTRH